MKIYSDYSQHPVEMGKIDAAQIRLASPNYNEMLRFRVSSKEFSGGFILKGGEVIAQRKITAEQAREAADAVLEVSAENYRQLAMQNFDVLGDEKRVNIGEFDGESVDMDITSLDEAPLVALLSLNENSLHIQEDGVWLETWEAKVFVDHLEDVEGALQGLVDDHRISQEDATALQNAYQHAMVAYVDQSGLDREEPEPLMQP